MTVGRRLVCVWIASTFVAGCALSHEIGASDSDDRSSDDSPSTVRDGAIDRADDEPAGRLASRGHASV